MRTLLILLNQEKCQECRICETACGCARALIGDHLSKFYKATEPRWHYKYRKGWNRIGTNKSSD